MIIKMTCTFEQYLIMVGTRSSEFTYSYEVLCENIEYFRDSWQRGVGAYKALTFLNFHLEKI